MYALDQRVTIKWPPEYADETGILIRYDIDLRLGTVRLDDYDNTEVVVPLTDIWISCVRCGEGISHEADAAEIGPGLCHPDCMLPEDKIT